MKVSKTSKTTAKGKDVKFSITCMNETEFNALVEGLRFVQNDETASRLLKQFTEIADEKEQE